ncbi:MAG TPA: cyclase family protein [Halobacteriales archaeon]|nr:cyclase family protein [Halobacteriales archaeon]
MSTHGRSHRDLSHPIGPDTWTYPGDPPVSVEPHATLDADGYRVSALGLGTHAGTHVDAPSHTEPDGAAVDEIPVESFAFDAVLARLDGDVGAREPIGPGRLPAVPDDADCLVLDTGWATHWRTDRYLDHPYLTAEAAAWCADRGLSVAIDAPSVDPSPSENAGDAEAAGHPAHHELLGAGLVIVENLTGLGGLPERFELRAYPLRIAGGDGSPVRAVAEW